MMCTHTPFSIHPSRSHTGTHRHIQYTLRIACMAHISMLIFSREQEKELSEHTWPRGWAVLELQGNEAWANFGREEEKKGEKKGGTQETGVCSMVRSFQLKNYLCLLMDVVLLLTETLAFI